MPIRQALDAVRAEVEERFEAMRREMEERFGAPDAGRDEVFRPLPEPSGLDMPLAEALAGRRTERSFSDEPISDQVLSALLHAADGINRADGKRTTPSCMNWQEVDIYALKPNGIWRWIPERRGMLFCALDDIRRDAYVVPTALTTPPLVLVYVVDDRRTRSKAASLAEAIVERLKRPEWSSDEIEALRRRACVLDVGAKIQSVYLAASALGIACSARLAFSPGKLEARLKLRPDERVIAAQSIGYRPKSILDHIR